MSNNMLKVSSKRRRTLAQVKADREESANQEAAQRAKNERIQELEQ